MANYNWSNQTPLTARVGQYEDNGMIEAIRSDGGTSIRINPLTGEITTFGAPAPGGATREKLSYDPTFDYGLGPDSLGIIPVGRDAYGNPTKFYASSKDGGGVVYDTLEDAKMATSEYRAIKGASSAPSQQSTQPQQAQPVVNGSLTDPGAYENWWTQNKGRYATPTKTEENYDKFNKLASQPSEVKTQWDKTSKEWEQPSATEQAYNGLAGKFNDWGAYEDMYNRETDRAMGTQRGLAAARGMGDSSAAMKASGNLSAKMTDTKVKGMQDWMKTGISMAGSSDAARNTRLNASMTGAGAVDSSARNSLSDQVGLAGAFDTASAGRLNAERVAAADAQNAEQGRVTGGINSALGIASGLAGATSSSLNNANNSRADLEAKLSELIANRGTMDQTQFYAEANDLITAINALPVAASVYDNTIGSKPKTSANPYTYKQGLAAIEASNKVT